MDIKKWKYKESKSKPYPPDTTRRCNFCQKNTRWTFNPLSGHSQCSECGLRKIPLLKNLINSEGKIIKKDKQIPNHQRQELDQDILTKLLNKKVICTLSDKILEGILIDINKYEIVLNVANSKILIFKDAISMIKNDDQNN